MNFFANLFSEIILFFYANLGNLGFSIIVFTLLIRFVLLPLTLPSIKASKKIRELQPELDKLKKKFKDDKQGLALAQSQLYKTYNVNPIAGCLPQLLQFFFLIVLYRSIMDLFNNPASDFNFFFWGVDLSQPDGKYIFPVVAGLSQFLLSIMLSPATKTKNVVPDNSPIKKVQAENAKEEDVAEMASMMQQQMIFMMPIMTTFIALRLPSGLALYWIVGTIFTMVTQYFVSGWGGLATHWNKYVARGPFKNLVLAETKTESELKAGTFKTKKVKSTKTVKKSKKNIGLAAALANLDGAATAPKAKNTRATKSKSNIKKSRASAKKARKQKKKNRK